MQITQNPQVKRATGLSRDRQVRAECPPRSAPDHGSGNEGGHTGHFPIICIDHWVYLAVKEVMTSFQLVFKIQVLMVAINVFYCWPHATFSSC